MAKLTYKDAGVDIEGANRLVRSIASVARKTARSGLMGGIGGFGGLFDLSRVRVRRPVLVSSTDGVGTKLKIAFMADRHDTVGIDLVAMGVNDILTQAAEPLFFLDYFATGKVEPATFRAVVGGVAEGCRQAGCALLGGETAEMPSFYADGEYDLAGFSVGVVEKDRIPDPACYTRRRPWSSAFRPAGSTATATRWRARSCWTRPGLKVEVEGGGPGEIPGGRVADADPDLCVADSRAWREAPHQGHRAHHRRRLGGRTSRASCRRALRAWLRRGSWPVPPVFDLVARLGHVEQAEMDRTFNNGIGMALVVGAEDAPGVERALRRRREVYAVIGEIRKGRRGVSFIK